MPTQVINLNNTTPAAPAGSMNVEWQADAPSLDPSVARNVSAKLPVFTGDSGAGGAMGLVPAPASGDAVAGKFLSAAGNFAIPGSAGSGGGGIAVLFGTGAPFPIVEMVQSHVLLGTSVPSQSAVTAGNLLVVVAGWGAPLTDSSCSDTLGTVYTRVASLISADEDALAIFAGIAPASGSVTATVTGGSASYAQTAITEFSGASSSVDVSATGIGNSAQPSALSITTSQAGDLIFAAISGDHNATVYSAATGFSLCSFINNSDAQASEWCQQPVAGDISATFVATDNDFYAMAVVAFKASSSEIVAGSAGDLYFDTSLHPWQGYVYHDGQWNTFG